MRAAATATDGPVRLAPCSTIRQVHKDTVLASAFCHRLARIVEAPFSTWHWDHEADAPLAAPIERHRDGRRAFFDVGTPWSASFVSWCIRRAGASASDFRFSPQHWVFVHWTIRDTQKGNDRVHGFPVDQPTPEIGDLIQNNRNGDRFDFAHATASGDCTSHSAILIETGRDAGGALALTIGGSESHSVSRRRVRLDAKGWIVERSGDPYISVVKALM